MTRHSLSFVLALALLLAVFLGLIGSITGMSALSAAGFIGMLAFSILLIAAPAASLIALTGRHRSISHGLGRSASVSGLASFALGLLSLSAAMDIDKSLVSVWTLVGIAFFAMGALALVVARRTRDQWSEGRPVFAFLGPSGVGVASLVLLLSTGDVLSQHGESKYLGYRVTVRSDLRSLVAAEKAIFADSGHYSNAPGRELFRTSTGVVGPVVTLTRDGWIARAGHSQFSIECVVYMGSTPSPPAARPEDPSCTQSSEILAHDRETRRETAGFFGVGMVLATLGVWLAGRRGPSPPR